MMKYLVKWHYPSAIAFSLIFVALHAKLANDFEQYAQQYGYKAAHLRELSHIASALNKKLDKSSYAFAVPSFLPISSQEIERFLASTQSTSDENTLEAVQKEWAAFRAAQPRESNVLTPESKMILARIRDHIEHAFKATPFSIDNPTRNASFLAFLADAQKRNLLLMIRSTGREDSTELANAGGNESVAAVLPTRETVSQAIATVIASYFGERSLTQRIIAQDTRLFDTPLIPVLLQVMIGESASVTAATKSIPASGVIFSQEAQAGTPGVVQIQSSWGHNEGVVNGIVAIDTFYIGASRIIHPIVKYKAKRLAPATQGSKLVFVENAPAIRALPSLTSTAVQLLQHAAYLLQAHYQHPQDIEFVVLNRTIYLVQTRPIVARNSSPSFISDAYMRTIAQGSYTSAYPIVAGGNAVRMITSPEQIITGAQLSIDQALSVYLLSPSRNTIRAAIITAPAPALSHQATTFAGANVAVFYTQDSQLINSWLYQQNTSIMLDSQRNVAVSFTPSEEFSEPPVQLGWLTHPIAPVVSVMKQFSQRTNPADHGRLPLAENHPGTPTSALLNIIRQTDSSENLRKALSSLLMRVAAAVKKEHVLAQKAQKLGTQTFEELPQQLYLLFLDFHAAALETYDAFEQWIQSPRSESDTLIRLYPTTFLEALLKQTPQPEIIDNVSLASLIKTERQEAQTVRDLSLQNVDARSFIAQYAKLSNYALSSSIKDAWSTFLKYMGSLTNKEEAQRFAQMIKTVVELELSPLWLNTSFINAWTKSGRNASQTMVTLLQEYGEIQPLLRTMYTTKERFELINNEQWAQPQDFKNRWQNFHNTILTQFSSAEFIATLNTTSPLGLSAAITVMHKLVDTIDTAIKTTLKSNQIIESDKKIFIPLMLNSFYSLLASWSSTRYVQSKAPLLLDALTFKSLDAYLKAVQDLIATGSKQAKPFEPSARFNVSAAALGSKALWFRAIGGDQRMGIEPAPTLDDAFTLIHQNLLLILAILTEYTGVNINECGPSVSMLNKRIKQIEVVLNTDGRGNEFLSRPSLVGVQLDRASIVIRYNLPLNNHSNFFEVVHSLGKQHTELVVHFVGLPTEWRWVMVSSLARIWADSLQLKFAQEPIIDNTRGDVSFSWIINNPDDAEAAVAALKFLSQLNTAFGGRFAQETPALFLLAQLLDPEKPTRAFAKMLQFTVKDMAQHPEHAMQLPAMLASNDSTLIATFYKQLLAMKSKINAELIADQLLISQEQGYNAPIMPTLQLVHEAAKNTTSNAIIARLNAIIRTALSRIQTPAEASQVMAWIATISEGNAQDAQENISLLALEEMALRPNIGITSDQIKTLMSQLILSGNETRRHSTFALVPTLLRLSPQAALDTLEKMLQRPNTSRADAVLITTKILPAFVDSMPKFTREQQDVFERLLTEFNETISQKYTRLAPPLERLLLRIQKTTKPTP